MTLLDCPLRARIARRLPERGRRPCLIQRPPLDGYTMKFTLGASAGCRHCPPIFGDNWRLDNYTDGAVDVKSDSCSIPDGGRPGSGARLLGKGTLSDAPVNGICTMPVVTQMRSDTDPLGTGEAELAYHAHDMHFLMERGTRARPTRRRST